MLSRIWLLCTHQDERDLSLDETETEIEARQKKLTEHINWKHQRAAEGVRSKVANDYFILATPVMILLDTKTKEIVAMPANLNELKTEIK
jgi:hypothetical protein